MLKVYRGPIGTGMPKIMVNEATRTTTKLFLLEKLDDVSACGDRDTECGRCTVMIAENILRKIAYLATQSPVPNIMVYNAHFISPQDLTELLEYAKPTNISLFGERVNPTTGDMYATFNEIAGVAAADVLLRANCSQCRCPGSDCTQIEHLEDDGIHGSIVCAACWESPISYVTPPLEPTIESLMEVCLNIQTRLMALENK